MGFSPALSLGGLRSPRLGPPRGGPPRSGPRSRRFSNGGRSRFSSGGRSRFSNGGRARSPRGRNSRRSGGRFPRCHGGRRSPLSVFGGSRPRGGRCSRRGGNRTAPGTAGRSAAWAGAGCPAAGGASSGRLKGRRTGPPGRTWPTGGGVSGIFRRYSNSSGISRRDCPTLRPRRLIRPILVRTRSRTGCPRRASMRRTWRFRPSRIVTSTMDRIRARLMMRTWLPRVRPSERCTPLMIRRTSPGVTSPATVAT